MITFCDRLHEHAILIQPNCSANWRHNQVLLIAFSCWCVVVGIAFTAAGAWMVLPFLGLELAVMLTVLFWVSRQVHERQLLRILPREIIVEFGHKYPEQRWHFDKRDIAISVCRHCDHQDRSQLYVCSASEHICLGSFLNESDSEQLLQDLRKHGLPVCNDSAAARRTF